MRVNRKFYFITMLILVLITLSSVNCFAQKFSFGIGTGSTSGSFYPMGGTLSEYMNKYIPGVNCWPEVTGSSKANLNLTESGDVFLGLTCSNTNLQLSEETLQIEDYGFPENVCSIAHMGFSHGTFVVLKESKIQKIQDLKGKKIALGAPGEGMIPCGIHLLEAAGIDWQKDLKNQWLQYDGATDALINKKLDAFFFMSTALPASFVINLSISRPIRLLPIPVDLIKNIQDKHGKYLVPFIVKPGVYPWIKEPFTVFSYFNAFIVRKDADEDLVYKIAKLVYEKQEEMAKIMYQFSDWQFTPEALMTLDKTIPLHPGARKFYKEIGLLK